MQLQSLDLILSQGRGRERLSHDRVLSCLVAKYCCGIAQGYNRDVKVYIPLIYLWTYSVAEVQS